MRFALFVGLAVGLTTVAPSALALPTPGSEARAADDAFREGVERYDRGDFEAALAAFRRAYEIAPNHRVLYNIGRAASASRDFAAALVAFRGYVAQSGEELREPRKGEVAAEIARLEARVGYARLEPIEAVRALDVDGHAVRPSSPLPLNPGSRRLRIRRLVDGVEVTTETSVSVTAGGTATVDLSTPARAPHSPDQTPSPAASRTSSSVGAGPILLVAGGVVLAGAFATDLLYVKSTLDEFEERRARNAPDASSAQDAVKTAQVGTVIGYAIGAALVATGGVVLLLSRRSTASVGARPGGLFVSGRF